MNIDLHYNFLNLIVKPSDEGLIIVGILFVLIFFGILYVVLVVNPQEEKQKNEWIKNNEKKLLTQTIISNVLNEVGNSFPSCSKCNSNEFQLWEILTDKTVIRCVHCKKKSNIQIDIESNDNSLSFNDILETYIDLVQFTLRQGNTKLGEYLRNFLKWDFINQRKGTIIHRVITFHSNPNIVLQENTYEDIKNDEPSRRISQKVMDRVWNRDNGKCIQCGSNEKLEFDHIIPFSKGGSNTYRNIQLLCENCNRSKSNNIG